MASLLACDGEGDRVRPMEQQPVATLDTMTLTLDLTAPALGESVVATVRGHYSDGTNKDIAADVTWRSSNPAVLEPDAATPGKFVAKTEGLAQISAELEEKRAIADLTIGPAKLGSLEIVPSSGLIGMGGSLKVNVIASYTDGRREIVTKDVSWNSSDSGVLIPSATDRGYLVTFGQGQVTINASLEGKTGSGTYEVTPPRVDYLVVNPQNSRLSLTTPTQYTVRGHWTDQRFTDVDVEWSVSDPLVATIDAEGNALALAEGTVAITASYNGGEVTASATARSVTPGNCDVYAENPSTDVRYDTVIPPLFWLDAFQTDGSNTDFSLNDAYCNAIETPVIIFAVSAGWCPYCPAYMENLDNLGPELEALGAKIVFVVIETATGAPADSPYANTLVDHDTAGLANSIRVGDQDTQGGAASPFSRAVQALPSAFVVRTRDMRIIASQDRASNYLDFIAIAQNPERLW